jgi:hypothetical protein
MKAKYYLGLLSILLLFTLTVKAQRDDSRNYRNDDDYYFTSRINRFHRFYTASDYYSPVFTDSYWYNYHPFSLGLSLYGGRGFGLGFSFNFPVYDYGYGDYYGYDPYFGSNYYWDYDPFYYNGWYSPFIFSFNFGNRWRNNYSSSGYPSRRNSGNNPESSVHNNNVSRRGISSGNYSRNVVNNNRPVVRSDNGLNTGETRRNIYAGLNNNRSGNNMNKGINYGRYVRSNTGITTHSSRTMSAPHLRSSSSRSMSVNQVHSSSSRSMSSGSGTRSSSSHGGSRSSGSSRGKSSGRR